MRRALAPHYRAPVTKCVSLHSIYRTTRTLPTNHTVIIRPQSWEITYSDMCRFRIRPTKRPGLSEPPRCAAPCAVGRREFGAKSLARRSLKIDSRLFTVSLAPAPPTNAKLSRCFHYPSFNRDCLYYVMGEEG